MFGLPIEAVSMLGSTILGGVMKIWSQKTADKAAEQRLILSKNLQINASIDNAALRDNTDGGNYFRRLIALIAIVGGLLIVFLAPWTDQLQHRKG